MEKKALLEVMEKYYSYQELIEKFIKKDIISTKDIKQKVSAEKLENSIIENSIEIKLFKSFYSDKYIVLQGGKYLLGLYREMSLDKEYKYIVEDEIKEENLNDAKKLKNKSYSKEEIKIIILYSVMEKENKRAVYSRIKSIYGISIGSFFKKFY